MYIQTGSLKGSAATSQEPLWPIGNLGQAAKGTNKFDECWEPQKNAIQAAFENALRSLNYAAAILGSAYGKPSNMSPRTRQLLNRHFHTTDRGNVLRIFRTIFRIQQAFDKGLNFECETNCQGGTMRQCGYAWATQWFGGKGDIHICFDNRHGHCGFMGLSVREQAALIIHEAAHRHAGIDDKVYVWEKPPLSSRDYRRLTSKEAMDNADSYAWFSVQLFFPRIDPRTLRLRVGGAPGRLTLSDPRRGTIVWVSSNPAVATVDATGGVSPVARGHTTIRVTTAEGNIDEIPVNVDP
jgi:hypothetical protein